MRRLLTDEIVGGHLLPGTRLDECEQAKRFHCSRTPVREAFRQLAALGLVENRPHRGVIVTPRSRRLVLDLYEACAEVLGSCIRLAATRMTDDQFAALAAMTKDDQRVRALLDWAGNKVLCDMVATVWGRLQQFLPATDLLGEVVQGLGRDGDKAADALRARLMEMRDEACANLPDN
ncbi:MAG TPA: GntR family transcriptional regulator [Candidatus Omnitrophota bacterium]|nr:GntR family transcriptional regulator [Candidatus Omnitrophota bacterium]